LVWNSLGSLYITSLKDRGLKFTDPRSASVALSVPIAHEGGKCIKLASLGDDADRLLTAGSSKSSLRQCKIWDPRNLSTEVSRLDVDSSPGALMPFYDPDTCLLYLAGKGDANIRYYEISAGAEFLPVSEFKSSAPAKGVAYVPKRALDAPNCEIGRLLKLTSSSVEPVRFYVPRRRSSAFPRDLFPDVRGDVPTHTAEQWMAGSDLLPALISLNPAVVDPQAAPAESSVSAFIASYASRRLSRAPDLDLLESQTRQALTEQIAAARRRIFFLESKLRKAGLLAL
jgi:coronin-1B/1C/6